MKRNTILISLLMVVVLGGMLWFFAIPEGEAEQEIKTEQQAGDSSVRKPIHHQVDSINKDL